MAVEEKSFGEERSRLARSFGSPRPSAGEWNRGSLSSSVVENYVADSILPIRERKWDRYGRYPSGSINSLTLFSATSGEVPEFQRGGGTLPFW